jgi:hypothetical protein
MATSWDEIIAGAMIVKQRGGFLSIARHELKAALPKEFREAGVTDVVAALNSVLADLGLIAILECGVVTVSRAEDRDRP